jgi:putative peptidoglycan lipid II flippase
MASTLSSGSIAALNFAIKLHSMLTQMFIMVISRVVLPFFAQQVAEENIEALKATYILTIKKVLFLLLPISALIIVFGGFIVQMLFERGAFSAQSTAATAGAWIAYTIGLPIQAVGILTARVYNALQDNKTLMYVSGVSIGLNILLNWTFMKIWGHVGIALSTSGVYVLTTIVLVYLLNKKLGSLWRYPREEAHQ